MSRAPRELPIRYVITTHGWLEGARLSRRGDWCNHPHASEEEARQAAAADARGLPFKIECKHFPIASHRERH